MNLHRALFFIWGCNDFEARDSNIRVKTMIAVRNASYCNLKLIMIYLVVLGHMIEPQIETSAGLRLVYQLIYSFHMPMFAFLTGLFVQSQESCKKQGFRLLKLYCNLQIMVVIATAGKQAVFTPYWHLWYLLSGASWMLLGWLWFRFGKKHYRISVLMGAVILGCAIGYVPQINRVLSLSRTIVYFPCFFVGVLCAPAAIYGKRCWSAFLAGILSIGVFFIMKDQIPVSFLYHAGSYGQLSFGWVYRLAAYGISGGMTTFLLSFAPGKRYWFTKLGADTLPTYLFHGPVVLLLWNTMVPWYLLPLLDLGLMILIYRISCLFHRLHGIVENSYIAGKI